MERVRDGHKKTRKRQTDHRNTKDDKVRDTDHKPRHAETQTHLKEMQHETNWTTRGGQTTTEIQEYEDKLTARGSKQPGRDTMSFKKDKEQPQRWRNHYEMRQSDLDETQTSKKRQDTDENSYRGSKQPGRDTNRPGQNEWPQSWTTASPELPPVDS